MNEEPSQNEIDEVSRFLSQLPPPLPETREEWEECKRQAHAERSAKAKAAWAKRKKGN